MPLRDHCGRDHMVVGFDTISLDNMFFWSVDKQRQPGYSWNTLGSGAKYQYIKQQQCMKS